MGVDEHSQRDRETHVCSAEGCSRLRIFCCISARSAIFASSSRLTSASSFFVRSSDSRTGSASALCCASASLSLC